MAFDTASDAAYNSGFSNGSNGGSGFGAWQINNTSANSSQDGEFIGDSSQNGSGTSGNINTTGNKSWGMYANSGNTASAVRPFVSGGVNGSTTLGVGETVSISMDTGFEDTGAVTGISLQNSSGTTRFEFYFTGGQSFYDLNVAGAEKSTNLTGSNGIPFTSDGLSLTFTQLGGTSWSLAVTPSGGATHTYSSTDFGTLAASDISQIRLFNFNGGSNSAKNTYFNNIQVVPEPSSGGLLVAALGGLGILACGRRRAGGRE